MIKTAADALTATESADVVGAVLKRVLSRIDGQTTIGAYETHAPFGYLNDVSPDTQEAVLQILEERGFAVTRRPRRQALVTWKRTNNDR